MNTPPAPSALSLVCPNSRWKSKALLGALVLSLAACGGGGGSTGPSATTDPTGDTGATGSGGTTSPVAFSVSAITCTPNPATIDSLITCVVTGTALPTAPGLLTLNTSQTTGSGVAACPATWAEASTPVPTATAKSFTCTPQGQGTTVINLNLQARTNGNNAGGAQTLAINSLYAVTTLAGSTAPGSKDGTGSAASFYVPVAVAVDSNGNVYVADNGNNLIRKITPAVVVTTLVVYKTTSGNVSEGFVALFNQPSGVAVDSNGNIYVADSANDQIRKITPTGVISTLAGSKTRGNTDGTGSAASFNYPYGVAVDSNGNVYVVDNGNHGIRKITSAGVVTTLAGSGTKGNADGTGSAASFYSPAGLAVDSNGNVYVADTGNNAIRKITPAGVVTTLAGVVTTLGGISTPGNTDGTGSAATFNYPYGVAVDSNGNIYVADNGNHLIRKVTPAGVVTTLAGSSTAGSSDGLGSAASFATPYGVAVDSNGNVYVADRDGSAIRKMTHY